MGEGSEQCLKLQVLGRAVTSAGCLSCLPSEEGSFPQAKPALISRSHTRTHYLRAWAGRGAAASPLAHDWGDFGAEPKASASFTAALLMGRDLG